MSRALLVLTSDAIRKKAVDWISRAPEGTRIEFKGARRSLDQNSRLWAMLTDVADQAAHNGRKYTTNEWKVLFLHACGREMQFIQALDGKTFLPFGQSSSDLSKEEMTALIDFIESWGAENGVVFHDQPPPAATEKAA
jgi:hypothetical protein